MTGRRHSVTAAASGILALVFATTPAGSQSSQDAERVAVIPRARLEARAVPATHGIRLNVKVVMIPVTVTDPRGRALAGLPRTIFHLLEDGVEQKLSYFANEDAPVSMGIVFDASGSMQTKLDESREAMAQIFRSSMPGDEFFLVEFNDSPRILSDFTSRTETIEHDMAGIRPKGWTALFDAVYLAVHQMRRARNTRKVLLILSDGGDNNSRYTQTEIKSLVREADVCIYSIGILGSGFSNRSVRILRELAEDTGGRLFTVDKTSELSAAVDKLNAALRNQYLLGYSSTNALSDGKYRKVQVRLSPPADVPPLHASWRVGYYAPAQ